MIKVVSFDYFPVFDVWDVDFTETDPWSVNFEWLGYETLNFLEGMGSITIFVCIILLYTISVAIISVIKCNLSQGSMFRPMRVFHTSVGFFQGTFYELLICISVSMKMFDIIEYLNDADKISIAC